MKKLLTFGFILIAGSIAAQSILDSLDMDKLSKRQLKSLGKNSLAVGDPYWAIDFFEKYLELKEDDIKVTFMLADAYYLARDYEMAEANYAKVVSQDPEEYPLARYYLARMQMTAGKYDEALEEFEAFSKAYRGQTNDRTFRRFVKAHEEGCEIAQGIKDSALKLVITHIDTSINKAHVESSPLAISDTTMLYASLKADTTEIFMFDDTTRPNRKLYVAELEGRKWVHSKSYLPQVNGAGQEVSNFAFSPDFRFIFFTVCEEPRPGMKDCRIYRSTFVDSINDFADPVILPEEINDKKYGATMPAVGIESKPNRPERLVLYYVSERDGGRGNKDIWFSIYDERRDNWKRARNAGSSINTVGDELTPFYDFNTASLYFSSNALPGLGGYDIFRADGQTNRWTDPENVGYPLNTGYDDIYFTIAPSRETGFLVSNRPGGVSLKNETCCDDIYEYRWSEFIKIDVSGEVYAITDSTNEAGEDNLLKDATVTLYVKKGGGEPVMVRNFNLDDEGKYNLTLEHSKDYVIEVKRDGYETKKYAVNTDSYKKSDSLYLSLGMELLPKGPVILNSVYYDFDDYRLNESSKRSLDTTLIPLLRDNDNIIVEISSHTDSKGDDRYNQKLSQKRAKSVVDYLIEQGIEKERLQAKGYGETQPIAPNENSDGSDNEAGRQKNRRTEFRIIGKIDRAIFYED